MIPHFLYNIRSYENDIAILALDSPFIENQFVRPISLPFMNQETSGSVDVSGWGHTSQDGRNSGNSKGVIVQIVPQWQYTKSCGANTIFDSMMCAAERGKCSCQNDSGGPGRALWVNYLAGIVSIGYVTIMIVKKLSLFLKCYYYCETKFYI